MADFDNVTTLRANENSPTELAIDLHKAAEKAEVIDALIVTRGPEGALAVDHTSMDSAEIAEMANYLSAYSLNMVWTDNEAPQIIEEEGEGCDED